MNINKSIGKVVQLFCKTTDVSWSCSTLRNTHCSKPSCARWNFPKMYIPLTNDPFKKTAQSYYNLWDNRTNPPFVTAASVSLKLRLLLNFPWGVTQNTIFPAKMSLRWCSFRQKVAPVAFTHFAVASLISSWSSFVVHGSFQQPLPVFIAAKTHVGRLCNAQSASKSLPIGTWQSFAWKVSADVPSTLNLWSTTAFGPYSPQIAKVFTSCT